MMFYLMCLKCLEKDAQLKADKLYRHFYWLQKETFIDTIVYYGIWIFR